MERPDGIWNEDPGDRHGLMHMEFLLALPGIHRKSVRMISMHLKKH